MMRISILRCVLRDRLSSFCFVKLVLAVALMASSALAQMESATVLGRVTDQSGAVIRGVEVEVRNLDTNVSVVSSTNAEGFYAIQSLHPGRYVILVRKQGFKTVSVTNIDLNVQDNLVRNFALQIGAVSESITVEAESGRINTTDASVSTVVDRNFVANTPLNGRSFQDLISMTPGVVTQSPNSPTGGRGTGGDFSVNGQRTESNYFMVDGVSGNVGAGDGSGNLNTLAGASGSIPGVTALGTTQSLVSVDALQEFRVQSSTYSAEYGHSPGGQFSLVTRSGTNNLHGTLFDYVRNDFFDANDWFNDHLGEAISPLRQNDFGGTLGGPISIPRVYRGKDKTFFFFSYEGLRLVQPQAATTNRLVPDLFMRQQAPAALQPLLNAFALPNGKDFGTSTAPNLAQFVQSFSLPSQLDSYSVRLDHTVGSKLSLFFRFADTPTFTQTRGVGGSASVLTTTSFDTQTFTLGAVSQLSTKVNNDFRLGYAISNAEQKGEVDGFGGATPVNLATAIGAGTLPNARIQTQIFIPGAGFSVLVAGTSQDRLRQWNLIDTLSVISGHHQLNFGADYRRIASPTDPTSPFIILTFISPQSILNNTLTSLRVVSSLPATPIFNEFAAFVQDEWHIVPRLNLSFGLRWEVDPPPHGVNGNDAFTLRGNISNPASLTLAPRDTPLWNTSWYNLAPRLGAAWTARDISGWQTVIRTGGGVFFDTNNQIATSGFSGGAVGFGANSVSSSVALPLTPAQLNLSPSVSLPITSNVYAYPAHLQLPYTLEWSVGVQQALGNHSAFTASYLGSAARRLQGQQILSINAVNPNFNTVVYYRSGLTSDYDALQLKFQSTVSSRLHALASYTWSHCIDFGSSYASLPLTRGNCDMDIRHNVQGGVSWDLPAINSNRFIESLVNHWGLDSRLIARTGFPVGLCGNQVIDQATGSQFCAGLNVVPNEPLYLYSSLYPGGRAINPAAFSFPNGTNIGNAPRNFARALGEWQINMAVRREFSVNERLRVQFRAEAFNILNHPNFGFVDPTLSSATFGQATAMLNQNLTTVASQYQQGGPRSMQFAIKLMF
jgi:hypothetical protein